MKRSLIAVLASIATGLAAAEPVVLENDCIRVKVDPSTAAVTEIFYRKAIQFPFIADKGAGIAGCGALFRPSFEGSGLPAIPAMRLASQGPGELDLVSDSGPCIWRRRILLKREDARIYIEDSVENVSGRTEPLRVDLVSRQEARRWRLTDRSWIGGKSSVEELETAAVRPTPPSAAPAVSGRSLFWRQIEQYGTGLLQRIQSADFAAEIRAAAVREEGNPVEVEWRSEPIQLSAASSAKWSSVVTVDEGGGPPEEENAFAPVLVRADFAKAGRSGQPLTGFATVVSPAPRRVRLTVATDRKIAETEFDLTPGKVARLPVTFLAASPQPPITVTVAEDGREIARASARPLIDGDPSNPVWQTYTRRMPEEHYRGTWEQIGEQVVRNRSRLRGGNSVEIEVAKDPRADNGLSYYREHLPSYAGFLTGAAKAMGAEPERLLLTEKDEAAGGRAACMDVAFYGPDGPINAFSKERDGPNFKGLGYVKVVPTEGYRFHIYMHYGINSAGLSISGASLNEDEATTQWSRDQIAAWGRLGRRGIPPRIGIWMLLNTCGTVEQALALMQNPEAPILMGPSDMLLLDREGHAACVESAGREYRVYRHGGGRMSGFYVSGNYPHPTPDGRFRLGPNWGWAANTMLRERFLAGFAGPRQGRLSLIDVINLMQSHEAGGMCQHVCDNPGQLYTSCSFIAVTRTGDLWLSEGPPCETAYVRHTLND